MSSSFFSFSRWVTDYTLKNTKKTNQQQQQKTPKNIEEKFRESYYKSSLWEGYFIFLKVVTLL
jgi:hypothetical protein